jgi:hypothetical protein
VPQQHQKTALKNPRANVVSLGPMTSDREQPARPSASKHPTRHSERPRSRRRDELEPLPILGGNLVNAAIAACAMLIIFPLENVVKGPVVAPTNMNGWHVGGSTRVRLTVITMDYERLLCASDKSFGEDHCQYKDQNTPWPQELGEPLDDNKKHVIQPYRTYPDNQLILVSGIWSHPVIATRLHQEPWQGFVETKLQRFVIECDVDFISKIDEVSLRWKPDIAWGKEANAIVARSRNCWLGSTE